MFYIAHPDTRYNRQCPDLYAAAMIKKPRLLIVEDEDAILKGLTDLFVFNGYEVQPCQDGESGLQQALRGNWDCVILDVMLPKLDGFAVCREIRKHSKEQPIIMLTAKSGEDDVINGLSLGADDYMAKPFSVRELLLRVEALLRRSGRDRHQQALLLGHINIDLDNLTGNINGNKVQFTRREIDVLLFLHHHNSRPVSRRELLNEVWGYNKRTEFDTRTVDIHIAKLRKKIELKPKSPDYLVTVRGEGYRLMVSA